MQHQSAGVEMQEWIIKTGSDRSGGICRNGEKLGTKLQGMKNAEVSNFTVSQIKRNITAE